MKTVQISDKVYIISDIAGCCSNLVLGRDRALVFDTCAGIEDLRGAVREITDLPLLVINSHGHFDHIGGNSLFDEVYLRPADLPLLTVHPAPLLEQWMREMSGGGTRFPVKAGDFGRTLPLDLDSFDLGDMECKIVPLPGHTAGSVGVYIPKLRLLLSGDAFTPVLLLVFAGHGTVEDEIASINTALALDFDVYLTSHHETPFTKDILRRLLGCLESVGASKGYRYTYPKPPYSDGRLYIDRKPGEPVAVVV